MPHAQRAGQAQQQREQGRRRPAAAHRHDHVARPSRPHAGDLGGGRQLAQRPGGDHHGEDTCAWSTSAASPGGIPALMEA